VVAAFERDKPCSGNTVGDQTALLEWYGGIIAAMQHERRGTRGDSQIREQRPRFLTAAAAFWCAAENGKTAQDGDVQHLPPSTRLACTWPLLCCLRCKFQRKHPPFPR